MSLSPVQGATSLQGSQQALTQRPPLADKVIQFMSTHGKTILKGFGALFALLLLGYVVHKFIAYLQQGRTASKPKDLEKLHAKKLAEDATKVRQAMKERRQKHEPESPKPQGSSDENLGNGIQGKSSQDDMSTSWQYVEKPLSKENESSSDNFSDADNKKVETHDFPASPKASPKSQSFLSELEQQQLTALQEQLEQDIATLERKNPKAKTEKASKLDKAKEDATKLVATLNNVKSSEDLEEAQKTYSEFKETYESDFFKSRKRAKK